MGLPGINTPDLKRKWPKNRHSYVYTWYKVSTTHLLTLCQWNVDLTLYYCWRLYFAVDCIIFKGVSNMFACLYSMYIQYQLSYKTPSYSHEWERVSKLAASEMMIELNNSLTVTRKLNMSFHKGTFSAELLYLILNVVYQFTGNSM